LGGGGNCLYGPRREEEKIREKTVEIYEKFLYKILLVSEKIKDGGIFFSDSCVVVSVNPSTKMRI
jgi:hypothetical protein